MELTNTNSSKPQGLEGEGREREEMWVEGAKRGDAARAESYNNTEQRECIVWAGSNVAD